jgi:hypothetical protein
MPCCKEPGSDTEGQTSKYLHKIRNCTLKHVKNSQLQNGLIVIIMEELQPAVKGDKEMHAVNGPATYHTIKTH